MCGLVGFVGKSSSKKPVLDGLARLEYRGYDSAGFATLFSGSRTIYAQHEVGELSRLIAKLEVMPEAGCIGIGHTRWATHGVPSVSNAHPHLDCKKSVAVAHNGIIENFAELKQLLVHDHEFTSETDTEVIAHFIESLLLKHSSLKNLFIELGARLQGAFALTIVLKAYPSLLIAVRKRSPLCVGTGPKGAYVASDQLAFAGQANKLLFLPDESFAFITEETLEVYDFNGNLLPQEFEEYSVTFSDIKRGEFEHFMLKEIYEQKHVIARTVDSYRNLALEIDAAFRLDTTNPRPKILHIIACGTSWHAGFYAKYFFQELAGIQTSVHIASEFRYERFYPDDNAAYLFVSQSGETADTLEAIRLVKKYGGRTLTLTNVLSSSMARECDAVLPVHAGPEISVASTKAFTGQVAALYAIAHRLGIAQGYDLPDCFSELSHCAMVLENALELYKDSIEHIIAPFYSTFEKMLFVGRQESFVLAQEAALKVKEISYIFADAIPAGELKHGSLALVDLDAPVVLFSTLDPLIYQKLLSCAQEIKARPSRLLVFAFQGQDELINLADDVFIVEKVAPLLGSIAHVALMQYFAYEIARVLQRPIDKPRNLAKSVTVE